MIPNEVARIATEVRIWAESNRTELGCSHPDLCGLCAITAAELYRRLKKFDPKIDVSLAYSEDGCFGHVFLLYNENIKIDLTATQFAMEDEIDQVHVSKLSRSDPWYWRIRQIFNDDKELHSFQVKEGWSDWQQANRHILNKRKPRARAKARHQSVAA
jgi:hypothetical protein